MSLVAYLQFQIQLGYSKQLYFMGCTSTSESFEPTEFENKAVVWFLGGGPGSPKQQVAQHLAQRYKFKYLSAMELIRFEEAAGTPQSSEIKKALSQKAELSSGLILRVLQKVLVLYGPRKYLIDNFPRSLADATEFQALCTRHPQVRLQGYLQLQLEEKQMKESGVKALSESKKDASAEDIEKEVRGVIDNYRDKSKPVLQFYSGKQALIMAPFPKNDASLTISQVQALLTQRRVYPVKQVSLFCLNGNVCKEVYSFGLKLARQFGLKFWSMDELKDEAMRGDLGKQLQNKKEDDIEGSVLVELLRRKLQRYNYKGNYLITGFPRAPKDVAALRGTLSQQVNIVAHISYLRTPATPNEQDALENLYRFFAPEEQVMSTIVRCTQPAYSEVEAHMRVIFKEQATRRGKVVVCPTFEWEGSEHFKMMEEYCQVVDFNQLVNNQINQQKFASSLLTTCVSHKKPAPSYIAGGLFTETVNGRVGNGQKVLVLKGFPQDMEQLKIILSKSEAIGSLSGLFIQSSRIRKNMKADESLLAQYQKLCEAVETSCDKVCKISEKTTYQQVKTWLTTL